MLHYTLIPSHCIQVDIERLLLSLAVKLHNFGGPKIDKKVINSSTKCLISVKIAILTPHIITTAIGECLVDVRFAETCKLTWFTFFKDFHRLEKWGFIACSNRQFEHTDLYVATLVPVLLYVNFSIYPVQCKQTVTVVTLFLHKLCQHFQQNPHHCQV